MGSKSSFWWTEWQTASYPAYVTLVDPPSIAELQIREKSCIRVDHVLLDDILSPTGLKGSPATNTIEVKDGSFILVSPEDAEHARAAVVSPPWLCRVNSIWFIPGAEDEHKTPMKLEPSHVVRWEKQQLAAGRLAANHFRMSVTYFYRWPDFEEPVGNSSRNFKRLSRAFRALGITSTHQEFDRLFRKPGAGKTPPTHLAMKYVMYSSHMTQTPLAAAAAAAAAPRRLQQVTSESGEGSEHFVSVDEQLNEGDNEVNGAEPDAGNEPVPMESVMGTAKVWFLNSNSKLPYLLTAPPSKAVRTAPGRHHVPAEQQQQQQQQHRQLPPGFLCNTFLDTSPGVGAERLHSLQAWADGTAAADQASWVANSRKQVKQYLDQSTAELAALQQLLEQQQQHNPMAATAAAAAVAAGGLGRAMCVDDMDTDDKGDGQLERRTPGQQLRQQQQQGQEAGTPGSSSSSSGRQYQRLQQRVTPQRRRAVLEDSSSREDEQAACDGSSSSSRGGDESSSPEQQTLDDTELAGQGLLQLQHDQMHGVARIGEGNAEFDNFDDNAQRQVGRGSHNKTGIKTKRKRLLQRHNGAEAERKKRKSAADSPGGSLDGGRGRTEA